MHIFLNHDWGAEIARDYILALTKDEELMNSIFAFDPEYFDDLNTYIMTDFELEVHGRFHNKTDLELEEKDRKTHIFNYIKQEIKDVHDNLERVHEMGGSNSWVISGKHTKSGKPILVNDPHLSNTIPGAWYLVHIEYPDGKYITGATSPGIPLACIFQSDKIAAGITAVFADNSDVYEEKVEDGHYLYKDKLYPLIEEEEIVKVKGGDEVRYTIKKTRNGPLITDYFYIFGHFMANTYMIQPNIQLSLRWSGMDPINYGSLNGLYKANFANNAHELLDIIKNSNGVSFNINFADTEGNIGFCPFGSFVIRSNEHYGATISKGWTGENEWIGYVKPEDRPYLFNPDKGFIVAANNAVSSRNVKHPVGVYAPSTSRARRITELIQQLIKKKDKRIVYEDMIGILNDTVDIYALHKKQNMVKIVVEHFKVHNHRNTKETQLLLHKILDWEGDFSQYKIEPTLYTFWEYYIVNNLLVKQIEDSKVRMQLLSNFHIDKFLMRLFSKVEKDPNYWNTYCSHYNSIEINSCPELITKAFLQAVSHLKVENQTHSVDWGYYHLNHYQSIPLTMSPLGRFFDRFTPTDGNGNTGKHLY